MKTLVLVLLSVAAMAASGSAWGAQLLGHRAVYELSLERTKSAGGIIAIEGLMVMEWEDSCEAYTLTQEIALRYFNAGGGVVASDFFMTSWETKDGNSFRFNTREKINGEVSEEFEGRANLPKGGGGGEGRVTLTLPKGDSVILPAGTLFPSALSEMLVDYAERGDRLLNSYIFDGSAGLKSLYKISAFIGNPVAPGHYPSDGIGAEHLVDVRSWPVQVAYFPFDGKEGSKASLPEYEVNFQMFANGVITSMLLDYGDIELRAALDHIDVFPDPDC